MVDPFPSWCTKRKDVLEKFIRRLGPYLEEITFLTFFAMGTIKWIAERCPKLKRLNAGSVMLNDDDWVACRNLEALSCSYVFEKSDKLGVLFRSNKRLRRLAIDEFPWLTASDFDHLDPGQLEFLQIDHCPEFELTADLVDKLAESLVELRYSTIRCFTPPNLQHLGKLKNLRYLDLAVRMQRFETEFIIGDIAENCRELERVFLVIRSDRAYSPNIFAPFFNLPFLRRLIIIVDENNVPSEIQRHSLRQRAAHLEFFVIDTCANCIHEHNEITKVSCDRHPTLQIFGNGDQKDRA